MSEARPGDPHWHSHVEAARVVDSPDDIVWDDAADLVVIGYGGAGVSAALEAAEAGLEVIAADRFQGGGATAMNGGVFYAGGGTAAQHEAGAADDPEEMFKYLRIEAAGVVSDDTLRRFCDTSVETVEWMTRHGVRFKGILYPEKTSYPHSSFYLYHPDNSLVPAYARLAKPAPRGHRAFIPLTSSPVGYGIGLYNPLRDAAVDAGVRLLTGAEARQLITDRGGRVIGVKLLQVPADAPVAKRYQKLQQRATRLLLKLPPAFPGAGFAARMAERWFAQTRAIEERYGVARHIRARRGVVLSAGGFIFNRPMVSHYAPKYISGMPLGSPGDDGSGIRLGQSAGGSASRLHHVSAWRFINPPYGWAQGMIVDARGERYVNESLYGAAIGLPMVEERGGTAWLILDHKLYKRAWAQTRGKLVLPFQKYPAMAAMRFGRKKAGTLDGLAKKCGFSPEIFRANVALYNAAARGETPDSFEKAAEDMHEIRSGPFYALDMSITARLMPLPVLTLGGLRVEEESGLVLDAAGEPIAGLYAAGRNAIGICSNIYVSGLSAADCVFSGRRAGRHAATVATREQVAA